MPVYSTMTLRQLQKRQRDALRLYNIGYAKHRKMLVAAMARHFKARKHQKNPDNWKTPRSKKLSKRYHQILYIPLIGKKQRI
jgi:hypothetical protein